MLDPTIYKDWQIAEDAEKTLPPVDYFREKLGLLPEDRKTEGLVLQQPIKENLTGASLKKVFKKGILRRKPEDQPPASLGKAYFREER